MYNGRRVKDWVENKIINDIKSKLYNVCLWCVGTRVDLKSKQKIKHLLNKKILVNVFEEIEYQIFRKRFL